MLKVFVFFVLIVKLIPSVIADDFDKKLEKLQSMSMDELASKAQMRFAACEDFYHAGYPTMTDEEKIKFGPASGWKERLTELSEQASLLDKLHDGVNIALSGYELIVSNSGYTRLVEAFIFQAPEKFSWSDKKYELDHFISICVFKSKKSDQGYYWSELLSDGGLAQIDQSKTPSAAKDSLKKIRSTILTLLDDYAPLCGLFDAEWHVDSHKIDNEAFKEAGASLENHKFFAKDFINDFNFQRGRVNYDRFALQKRQDAKENCIIAKKAHRLLISKIAHGAAAGAKLKKIDDMLKGSKLKTSVNDIDYNLRLKEAGDNAQRALDSH